MGASPSRTLHLQQCARRLYVPAYASIRGNALAAALTIHNELFDELPTQSLQGRENSSSYSYF